MSVESLAIALHHSRAKGAAKLILIGIANHDGDGGAWPSMKKLAKYGGVSVSQAQRCVTKLEELGEVRRFIQAGGDHRTAEHERPNRYAFLLRCPADCDRTSQHRTRHDDQRVLDLDPEQLPTFDDVEGAAPVRPGTGSHERDRAAAMRGEGAAPVRPKPSTQLATYLPETKPSDRARVFAPVWPDERCPANWKTSTHQIGGNGRCSWCHEAPTAHVDTTTGEVR